MGKIWHDDMVRYLFHGLMETPLADVIRVMESGEFFPPPKMAVKKEEVIIGSLTVFEKALITVRERLVGEANLIAETNDKMVDEARAAGEAIDETKVLENKVAHRKAHTAIEAFDNLFLSGILSRLGQYIPDGYSIGIREGYRVVRSPHKKNFCNIHVISIG